MSDDTEATLRRETVSGMSRGQTVIDPAAGPRPRAGGPVRILFIGAGDVRRSRGARTYLFSLVEGLRRAGAEIDAFFLQQLIAGPPPDGQDPMRTLAAPGARYAAAMPMLFWRLYEAAWAAWTGLRLALAHRTRCGVCIVTGPMLLPLTPTLRRAYRRLLYVEHGIAEELLVTAGPRGRVKYRAVRLLEHLFLRHYTAITSVSTAMGAYFEQRDGVLTYLLVPCGVDPGKFQYSPDDRARVRRALGAGNRFVFVYSGGADLWQRRSEMVRVFQAAGRSMDRPFLLLLSADLGPWPEFLAPLDPRDYAVVSAPHAEVGRYLSAADAAFLMRTRRLVDDVSCPVKFAEYLACGLPVVISPGIGDYTAIVERCRVGVVLDPDAPSTWDAALRALRRLIGDPGVRDRCLRVAEDLSWNVVASRLLAALGGGGRASAGLRAEPDDVPDRSVQNGVR